MHFHETPQKNIDAAAPRRRRKHAHEPELPTSIPVVVANVGPDGRLTVTVDGELFTSEPIGRAAFGSLLVRDVDSTAGSEPLEVTGDGFVPGEEVAFAPILIQSSARADGSVRSLVEFDGPVTELLVFGRISGTVHVVRPRP